MAFPFLICQEKADDGKRRLRANHASPLSLCDKGIFHLSGKACRFIEDFDVRNITVGFDVLRLCNKITPVKTVIILSLIFTVKMVCLYKKLVEWRVRLCNRQINLIMR